MSKLKNDKDNYEKYLKGEMSAEEAHVFEREVLNDPFEQEALEGLEAHDSSTVLSDIEMLQSKVLAKEKTGFSGLRIAAVISLLIVSSLAIWFSIDQIEGDPELAMDKQEVAKDVPAEETREAAESEENEQFFTKEDQADEVDKGKDDVPSETKEVPAEPSTDEVQLALAKPLKAENKAKSIPKPPTSRDEPVETSSLESKDLSEEKEFAVAAQGAGFSRADDAAFAEEEVSEEVVVEEIQFADALQGVPSDVELDSDAIALGDVDDQENEHVASSVSSKVAKMAVEPEADRQRSRKAKKGAVARSLSTTSSGIVSGNITDDTGEPLPGVNVVIKGSTTGTTTDLDGNYQIGVAPGSTLVLSFVGFETQEIEVGSRNRIDVSMGGTAALQEVVVTGYGVNEGDEIDFYSPAQPVGGTKSYKEYLETNLQYPEEALANNIEGTVVLELKISTDGTVSDITVKRSLGYGCDAEAIRLVREGPKWTPARKGEERLEDKVRVRVKFEPN